VGPSVYISLIKLVQCLFFSFCRDFDLVSYYEMSFYQKKFMKCHLEPRLARNYIGTE